MQPQSLMTYQQQPPNMSVASSGASSLPYISRSLSIDAYTQQQLEKKSQKCSELEEYAKRYFHIFAESTDPFLCFGIVHSKTTSFYN